jgi:hypothetical protein
MDQRYICQNMPSRTNPQTVQDNLRLAVQAASGQ